MAKLPAIHHADEFDSFFQGNSILTEGIFFGPRTD